MDDFSNFEGAQWIVFDVGSKFTRIGLGEDPPECRVLMPSCISLLPNPEKISWKTSPPRIWPGEEGYTRTDAVDFWPFKNGSLVEEWSRARDCTPPPLDFAMNNYFLHCIINELREDPTAGGVLIVENYPSWTEERKKFLANVLFTLEDSEVPFVAFCPAPIAILTSFGASKGLVVDFGASGVRICAVTEKNEVSPELSISLPFGGWKLIEFTKNLLQKKGKNFSEKEVDNFVTKHAQVVRNFASDKNNLEAVNFNGVSIDSETRCHGAEAFFNPSVAGVGGQGVAQAIVSLLNQLPSSEQAFFSQNIFLSGGPSAIPGLVERLINDLHSLKGGFKFDVKKPENPLYCAYGGASILSTTGIAGALSDNFEERGVQMAVNPDV